MYYKKLYFVLGMILLLTGCGFLENENNTLNRPYLPSLTPNDAEGFCLDKRDATLLLEYILLLEASKKNN